MSIAYTVDRFVLAAREGRLMAGISRHLTAGARELYWRARTRRSPHQADILKQAIAEARGHIPDRPSLQVRQIEGMSGQRYRTFINAYMRLLGDNARYLEVGSWKGSTLASAIEGNGGKAVCIDNWSLFGGPKEEFSRNIQSIQTNTELRVIEADFRKVDYRAIGKFNVYLFDGPHEEADQYDGVMLAQPALANPHTLIVDDWNWRQVRLGTLRAIHDSDWRIAHCVEIRTTGSDPIVSGGASDWHNGYFIATLCR
jgi:Methyltransferase domain